MRYWWYWINRYFLYYLPVTWHTNLIFLINCLRLRKPYYVLKLDNPQTFTEKLNRLKVDTYHADYSHLADKVAVRDFVRERIGEKYLVPMEGVYSDPNQIHFETLPRPIVLKATHGSGMNVFISHEERVDKAEIRARFKRWFKINPFYISREWQYRSILPRIIAERYLGANVPDYKLFCVEGKVKFIQLDTDRFSQHKRDLFTREWERIDVVYNYPSSDVHQEAPPQLGVMIELAEKLASGMPFVRVDFLISGDEVYFGELTFFPGGGGEPFDSYESDLHIGQEFVLSTQGLT